MTRSERLRRVVGDRVGALRAFAARRLASRLHARPETSWLLWWVFTGVLAVVALPLNVAIAAESFDVNPLVAFLVGIGQSTALLLLLVRPKAATALQFVSVAVMSVALPPDSGSPWPLTVIGMMALMAHVGLIAGRYPRRTALSVWWASVVLLTLLVLLDPRGRSISDGLGAMLAYLIQSVIVLGAVVLARRWRQIRRELADARHDVEVEQSQRAVVEERTRIARELHDVVAHSMSVIHMQSTSASYRLPDLDPAAKAEFTQIAAAARSAMREMRQLLAVLRDEGADAELTPVPDLARVAELVESAERAGVPVELRMAVPAATPAESVTVAAFRIIQESLSNVIRHAPGARTVVSVDVDGPDLVVVVENDAATLPILNTAGGGGHGLRGMRERARLAGGMVETGARDSGGYRVVARLPIGGPE
ncbi:sensor histidine kinase [Virgisporangium aurantiacum]|uniref:sensor histidine kinase n=1 Tax=Virgisporangium aurantiacum TaxID=175570 RepID=UPI001951C2B9|nr:histidine kinase [Virgisporangium aurantiacum]